MKLLQDHKGKKSSKRLYGSILISAGITFAIITYIFALFWGLKDPSTALNIVQLFLVTGGCLVGSGVFENGIININKNDKNVK